MFSFTFFPECCKETILRALLVRVTLPLLWATTKILLETNKDKFYNLEIYFSSLHWTDECWKSLNDIQSLYRLLPKTNEKEIRINSDGLDTDPQSMECPDGLPWNGPTFRVFCLAFQTLRNLRHYFKHLDLKNNSKSCYFAHLVHEVRREIDNIHCFVLQVKDWRWYFSCIFNYILRQQDNRVKVQRRGNTL